MNKQTDSQIMSYISIDINPSFELQLNKEDEIVEVKTFNKDAKRILKDIPLKGKTLSNALPLLLSDKQYRSYLEKGILEISIYSDNKETSSRLENNVNTELSKIDINQYHCGVVNEETHNQASNHHMSAGKYRVIETIVSAAPSYDIEALQKMSMKELYSIINDIDPSLLPEQESDHHIHH